jgi:hypothetical protein
MRPKGASPSSCGRTLALTLSRSCSSRLNVGDAALSASVLVPPGFGVALPQPDVLSPGMAALVDVHARIPAGLYALGLFAKHRRAPVVSSVSTAASASAASCGPSRRAARLRIAAWAIAWLDQQLVAPPKTRAIHTMPAVPPNIKSIVSQARKRWQRGQGERFSEQVSVDVSTVAGARRTVVKVTEHSIPDFRTQGRQAALRITQADQLLVKWLFDDRVVDKISEADLDKGRRLYCLDSRDPAFPVLAAVAFHVDAELTRPLQITAVAIRLEDEQARAHSYVAAWSLTQYVQAAATKLGRPDFIEMISFDRHADEDWRILGFEPVGLPTYARGGRAFRQPAQPAN